MQLSHSSREPPVALAAVLTLCNDSCGVTLTPSPRVFAPELALADGSEIVGEHAIMRKKFESFARDLPEAERHTLANVRKLMGFHESHARLRALAEDGALQDAVRKLLMADGALFDAFATAIFNTYEALVSTGVAEQSRPGWEDDGDTGRYLKNLGTARQPLKELAVTPMLGTEGVAAMLRDLERAEMGSVHGKSI